MPMNWILPLMFTLEDWSNGMKDSPEYVFQLMDGRSESH